MIIPRIKGDCKAVFYKNCLVFIGSYQLLHDCAYRVIQECGRLEFVGRADRQDVTNVICFRSQPFNLGMIATGNH